MPGARSEAKAEACGFLVKLSENAPADVACGAKPLGVQGLAKAVAARVMANISFVTVRQKQWLVQR